MAAVMGMAGPARGAEATAVDYSSVQNLFTQHCLDCHAAQDPEGNLVLESFETLMKGGESGTAIVAGKSADSLLVRMVEGSLEKEGKKKIMPPGKRKKLSPEEIALVRSWIDTGARAPKETPKVARELVLPKVAPTVPPRRSIQALAYAPGAKLLAVARYGEVELFSPESRTVVKTLSGHRGMVNAVAISQDGKLLAAASGEPALFGEVRLWNLADSSLVRVIEGHNDALYSTAISPDGKIVATGSYDQKIKLWELATGRELQTLSAHNGAIFDLAFRPDGQVLASASGDRTLKLWNVATGKRVETLSQPLKEQYALAWSPDGKRLAAAGVDNRIRVWEVSESAAETTNPLLLARFAHEGAILNLAFSPDGKTLLSSAEDRTIKLWEANQVTERLVIESQPDVTPGITFLEGGRTFAAGRLDGTLEIYDSEKGKRVLPPGPELRAVTPRGLERGKTALFKLAGKNLANVTNVSSKSTELQLELQPEHTSSELLVRVTATAQAARGPHEIQVAGPGGNSGTVKVFVDNLPQVTEADATKITALPACFWGTLENPGDSDEFAFEGVAGQTVVFDLASKSVGGKLENGAITLLDDHGDVLASEGGFDGKERFLAYQIPASGRYRVRVSDQMLGASAEHFYRLVAGALPYVTGIFPLSIGTNTEARIQLTGPNLPADASVPLKSSAPGEREVPLDSERVRAQRAFQVIVAAGTQAVEQEPNNTPEQARQVMTGGAANGRIDPAGDIDLYRLEAVTGRMLVIETEAARRGSPVDTRLEVLHPDGKPVTRVLLQAVRNTAINFRGVDSNATGMRLDNYEEMELNQYLYISGEVMRLFRMPQGPDSEMLMYPSGGQRRAYFDTSAVGHALDESGFIVEPQPLGTRLAANGLPVFRLNYDNDDDGERLLGSDSRVHFLAPTNGPYFVRVSDTRGQGGARHSYRLLVRQAKPDFSVALTGANPTVARGSGQSFTVTATRLDGFDEEIRVDIEGLPPGFAVSTPLVIQAGQSEAKGTLYADPDAPKPMEGTNATRVTATARVDGKQVTREVNSLGTIKLGADAKLLVGLEPYRESATNRYAPPPVTAAPLEITIHPGQTIPAWLKIQRAGHDELVTFFAENLPHGVIVADIGLNGLLIPKGEQERQIFFNAARWVPEQDRLFYLIEQQVGRQTSRPVLLKVRKPDPRQASK
jgi:mono/diheme cytochrome c family protein/sugar lactone lactonase YvrE